MAEIATSTDATRIACTSRIVGVVVHGRGAVVTREVAVPVVESDGPLRLEVGRIPMLADPGSVRVKLPDTARPVVAVESRVDLPDSAEPSETDGGEIREMEHRLRALQVRAGALEARAERLRAFEVDSITPERLEDTSPVEHLEQADMVSEVVSEALAAIDSEQVELAVQIEEAAEELERMKTNSILSRGGQADHRQSWRAQEILLGPQGELPTKFEISYVVPYAAKWWPLYSLRLMDGGTRARLTMEAVVAQRTGEEWDGVKIGLSTAEIVYDATLPRLPSLRLGKRVRDRRDGFRGPPEGTEKLFQAYDAFFGKLEPLPPGESTREMAVSRKASLPSARNAPPAPPGLAPPAPQSASFGSAQYSAAAEVDDHPSWDDIAAMSLEEDHVREREVTYERIAAAPSMRQRSSAAWGAGGAPAQPPAPPPPPEPSFEPGDEWLAFDQLVMSGPSEPRRGKLRRDDSAPAAGSEMVDARESARRMELVDPSVSRGLFDYRYDADGLAAVPADGRLHRFELKTSDAESKLRWRTVPLADPQVYREAVLHNPFPSPLLAGPIDVYVEGQLVTTSQVSRVDSDGKMRVGLGVDDRIKVARNVRVDEESAGLLGGKRELDHSVEIELRSALGFRAAVQVIDRIPVVDDAEDDVVVKLLEATAPMSEYDQRELERPVEGGRLWTVELEPGGREVVRLRYRITLRSKDELVGGGRRG